MDYEQYTFDGTIEIIDAATGELKGRKIIFTCEKPCVLRGEHFMEGEEIEATFPPEINLELCPDKKGPWEPGGLTSRWIRDKAVRIVEMSRGKVLKAQIY